MFRLLRVIIRSSTELIQVSLTTSALWNPVVLTICAKTGVHVNQTYIVYLSILAVALSHYSTRSFVKW
jgi:hypothetical protein